MIRKLTPMMIAAMFALLMLACSPTVEVEETAAEAEPVAAVEVEEVVETDSADSEEMAMEEEMEDSEEMAMEEESHDDDFALYDDSEEMAMEEEMDDSEEMAMEEEMEEDAEMADAGESMNATYAIVSKDSVLNWRGAKAVGDFQFRVFH